MRNSAGVTSNVGVICNARALDNAVVIVIIGVICSVGSLGNTVVIGLGVFDNVWGERDSQTESTGLQVYRSNSALRKNKDIFHRPSSIIIQVYDENRCHPHKGVWLFLLHLQS